MHSGSVTGSIRFIHPELYLMKYPALKTLKLLAVHALGFAAASSAWSDTISLPATADGFIRSTQSAAQTNNVKNTVYLVGNTAQQTDSLRAVLAFDLNVPELKGATIRSAQLVLEINDRDASGGGSASQSRELSLHALAREFDLPAVEWLRSARGTPWQTPGADFGPSLATLEANPAQITAGQMLTFSSEALTQAVQADLDGTLSLLVKLSVEQPPRSIFRFQSKRARLVIDYTPTAEAATLNAWKLPPPGQPETPAQGVSPIPGNPQDSESPRYTLVAGGHPVEVKASRYSFDTALFTMAQEPVVVDVMLKDAFTDFSLKPDRHGLKVERIDNALRFTLTEPLKLVLQVPGQTPLAILVTPAETEIPDRNDPNVVYYEPGVRTVGTIRPKSGQTFYFAPGAVVRGRIEARNVQNVRILGRGILDVTGHSVQGNKHPGVLFEDSENIFIEGIGIRSYNGWWQTLFINSINVTVAQVNLFGIGVNTDGIDIDAVKNFVVRDSFIRAEDDGLGWHSLDAEIYGEMITENALADNIVIWNTSAGNGIRIGASMEGQMWRDITIRNTDILQHAGAGIYSDYSDWAWTSNLRFENITIEKPSNPINFYIQKTRYSNLTNYLDERGNIDGLLFENVVMKGGQIRLAGYDAAHQISNVRFNQCVNAGVPLDSLSQLTLNAYVTDVAFNQPLAPLPVAAPGQIDITALESRSEGAPQFIARNDQSPFGRSRVLAADKAGAQIIHDLPAEATGTQPLTLTLLATPQGGIADLKLGDTTLAEGIDFYAASPTLKTIELGEQTLGNETALALNVTGKNTDSTGYRLELVSLQFGNGQ